MALRQKLEGVQTQSLLEFSDSSSVPSRMVLSHISLFIVSFLQAPFENAFSFKKEVFLKNSHHITFYYIPMHDFL